MAIVAASGNGAAPSTAANRKNNGSTLLHAGNVASDSSVTRNLTMLEVADDFGAQIGSKVVEIGGSGASTTDRFGVTRAVAAGTLAYQATATKWVMRGGNVTQTLAGVANTVLVSAGADFNGAIKDNIHELNSSYMYGSGGGTFNMYAVPSTEITPNYTKGGDAGSNRAFVAPSGAGDVTAVDNAAAPTRSVPGELTYHYGGLTGPTTDEYKAKDVYES